MPQVTLDVAYKWLNIDLYWNTPELVDPADDLTWVKVPERATWQLLQTKPVRGYPKELLEKYPLVNPRDRSCARSTCLHDPNEPDLSVPTPVDLLVSQMKAEVAARHWEAARKKIDQLEEFCSALGKANPRLDLLQLAEVRLECGLAHRIMGDNARALECFMDGVERYTGGLDQHGEALARWLTGWLQLETSPTSLNDGLVNWQTSWDIFSRLGTGGMVLNKTEMQWYKRRSVIMFADLQEAIAGGGIGVWAAPPPPPAHSTPVPGGATPTPRTKPVPRFRADEALAETWLRLGMQRVYHSIRAHPAGGLVMQEPDEYAEYGYVYIEGRRYQLHSVHNRRVIALNPKEQYDFVRVEGDSMDAAKPHPILEGDYVLMRITSNPADGEIVAATVANTTTADQVTLKLKKPGNWLHAVSRKDYPPIPPEQIRSFWGEVVAVAKPKDEG